MMAILWMAVAVAAAPGQAVVCRGVDGTYALESAARCCCAAEAPCQSTCSRCEDISFSLDSIPFRHGGMHRLSAPLSPPADLAFHIVTLQVEASTKAAPPDPGLGGVAVSIPTTVLLI